MNSYLLKESKLSIKKKDSKTNHKDAQTAERLEKIREEALVADLTLAAVQEIKALVQTGGKQKGEQKLSFFFRFSLRFTL
jgi:hypothetical protein